MHTDLEFFDCVLYAADGVHVIVVGLVANIALCVDLAGGQPQDLIDLHTQQVRTGATCFDPEWRPREK